MLNDHDSPLLNKISVSMPQEKVLEWEEPNEIIHLPLAKIPTVTKERISENSSENSEMNDSVKIESLPQLSKRKRPKKHSKKSQPSKIKRKVKMLRKNEEYSQNKHEKFIGAPS